MRWGRNIELIITDQRSYGSEDPFSRKEGESLGSETFTEFTPQELMEAIDGGKSYNGGNPPATLSYGKIEIPNYRRSESPRTFLGAEQKSWFLERLRDGSSPGTAPEGTEMPDHFIFPSASPLTAIKRCVPTGRSGSLKVMGASLPTSSRI